MTQQLLQRSAVVADIQEVSRERVPEGMTGRALRDSGLSRRTLHGALDGGS